MRQGKRREAALFILSLGFLAGGILGCLAEGRWLGNVPAEAFLADAVASGIAAPALWRELWVLLRWPALALTAGRFPLTRLTMPVLFCLRGFALSCGISAFVPAHCGAGWAASILLYGPTCLLALPVFFVLGVNGLRNREEKPFYRIRTVLAGILSLTLCAFLDGRVTPVLLSAILKLDLFS